MLAGIDIAPLLCQAPVHQVQAQSEGSNFLDEQPLRGSRGAAQVGSQIRDHLLGAPGFSRASIETALPRAECRLKLWMIRTVSHAQILQFVAPTLPRAARFVP